MPGDAVDGAPRRHPLLLALRFGGLAWAVAVGLGVGGGGLGVVEVVLAFAPTIVAPIGLDLLARGEGRALGDRLGRSARLLAPIGGTAAAFSLVLPRGGLAVVLAAAWAVVAAVGAAGGATAWLLEGVARWRHDRVGAAAAPAYLLVGALWLVVDRLGARPLGLSPDLVTLTAVHFHYAGFAAVLIATATALAVPLDRRRLAAVATWLTLLGPAVVAAGFALHGVLQVVGAVTVAGGLLLVAHLLFWDVRPLLSAERLPRTLLVVAALSVVAPMLLAVQWALGANLGTPALSIDAMARTHGVLNAFGFAFCGLVGWRLLGRLDRDGQSGRR